MPNKAIKRMVFNLHFAIPLRYILRQKCKLKTTVYRGVRRNQHDS